MTLVVGIFCTDGIVVAADRQATHGALGQPTVAQPMTKVQVIGTDTLFAASGHVGLAQQLAEVIGRKRKDFDNQAYHGAIKHVQKDFRELIDPALNTAGLAARVYGQQVAMVPATCGCLLGAPFKKDLKLVEISPQASVELMTAQMPFITLGSGKGTADSFLGFLRDVYWSDRQPKLREGTLAAYWTVKHAIDMKIQGVGFAVDVFELTKPGTVPKARQLEDAELQEHDEFIKSAKDAMRSVGEALSTEPSTGTLEVPIPSQT